MLSHVVMFRFADKAEVPKVKAMLEGLAGTVPQIRHLEVGVNVVPSDRAYDLCLVVGFDSLEDLQGYQEHPDHVHVAEYISSVRDAVAVVDYVRRE